LIVADHQREAYLCATLLRWPSNKTTSAASHNDARTKLAITNLPTTSGDTGLRAILTINGPE
jgi:hypothetical protein